MAWAGPIPGENPWEVLRYYGPAYLTAVGTMSSAATLAVALRGAKKSKVLRRDMVDFGIPLLCQHPPVRLSAHRGVLRDDSVQGALR